MLIGYSLRTNLLKVAEALTYPKADPRACKYTDKDMQGNLRQVYIIKTIYTVIWYKILH